MSCPEPDAPRFACDAMMRGLARWLRACGYDASWTYGIDDDVLLEQAEEQGRVVLTADNGILQRPAVRAGTPAVHYVPNDMPPLEQARAVMAAFGLELRPPRCMACGGARVPVDKESVRDEAPPRSFAAFEHFFRCEACGRLLWRGTHWERIEGKLAEIADG